MFPLIVMSKEPTFIMTLMMANTELRRKDMEDSYDNLYSLSYPCLKSNSLDKKSLKRTLRKCDQDAKSSSLQSVALVEVWEMKDSVLFQRCKPLRI